MSVADKLAALASDIGDCYDEVQSKGGTIPQNKNTNNLATAVRSIPSGITPTGQIEITQNGTYDVTDYASASVAVPEIKTVTVTKTLTTEETSISFENPLGVAPKAFILTNSNDKQTMQSGEIRRVTFFLINGSSYTNNRVNGQNQTVLETTTGDNINVMRITIGDDSISIGQRSNTYYLANVEYSLKLYWWEDDE